MFTDTLASMLSSDRISLTAHTELTQIYNVLERRIEKASMDANYYKALAAELSANLVELSARYQALYDAFEAKQNYLNAK